MAKIGIRVWILVIFLALALLAISPNFKKGIVIESVEKNSSAFDEGLRAGMIILAVNDAPIKTFEDYTGEIESVLEQTGDKKKIIIQTEEDSFILFTNNSPDITVAPIPQSRLKTGLDLSGGARALIKPSNVSLTYAETEDVIAIMNERLNVYGIKDIAIRPVKDLNGDNFILVEIAGATPDDIAGLLAQQGKFEAKIGNVSVFKSDEGDITNVCKNDARCSGVRQCDLYQEGYFCTFDFSISLSPEAAQKHADVTKNVSIDPQGEYLSEKLSLLIDNSEVSVLSISSSLRGLVTSEISIQGSGSGTNEEEALNNAKFEMKKLQTILQTGSLPYKFEIVKLDTISPLLGREFTKGLIMLAFVVFTIVSLAVLVWYRKIKVTLGIAAFINWNLDAPSIAGIIAGIGTGINDQIVIIDESFSNLSVGIKERVKRALFIILGAFLTIVAAMLPLFWAGAGLLRGFALTTIIGVTVGILITRPAFAEIMRKMGE